MDKVFAAFKAFFAWWADLTGTRYVHYKDGDFGVNWPIVTFMLFVILLMALFLPSGILDYFGVLYNG